MHAEDMDAHGDSGEPSDRSEECVIGKQRKGNPCCKAAKNLAKLYSVLWKVELASNEIGCLVEKISKQNV